MSRDQALARWGLKDPEELAEEDERELEHYERRILGATQAEGE